MTVKEDIDIAAPQFTSGTAFSTPENSTATGYTAQADAASGSVTYAISGGADQALFAIDENSGEVRFRAAPDYENPEDDGTNNLYNFTVTATSTEGGARATETQHVAITVTDVADEISPTLSLALSHEQAGDPLGATHNQSFWITFTFSEAVSGFDAATLNSSLTNATVSKIEPPALSGGRQAYDVLIAPSAQGAVRFDFADSNIGRNVSDAAGNPVASATPASTVLAVYDTRGPTVEITGVPDSILRDGTFTVTYTFSEQVGTSFNMSDVRAGLVNATASTFRTTTDGTVFTADITPDGSGNIEVSVPAAAAQDASAMPVLQPLPKRRPCWPMPPRRTRRASLKRTRTKRKTTALTRLLQKPLPRGRGGRH